jgi:hypothetical protein
VITDAMSALEVTGLLEVERRRSWPSVCKLLDERGTRAPYVRPGEPGPSHSVYVSVPTEFWTNGWIVTVEAAALTVFLIMLDQRGYPRSDEAFWLSPQQRSNRYGVSEDTLYSGARSLEALGLLSVARVPFSEVFDPTRVRNRYAPSWSTLSYSPTLLLGQSDSHAAGL